MELTPIASSLHPDVLLEENIIQILFYTSSSMISAYLNAENTVQRKAYDDIFLLFYFFYFSIPKCILKVIMQ